MPVILKSDNKYIYYSYGIKIVKLSLPDFTEVFNSDTNHEDSIIEFAISPLTLVTT